MKKNYSSIVGAFKKRLRLFSGSYDRILSNTDHHIHFVGIGGIGMSAIAYILKDQGFIISGSDMRESISTEKLAQSGISVSIGHSAQNISSDVALLVVSSAIDKKNPEIVRALSLGIPIVKRSFVLGQLMRGKRGIAVSGTHGKTTTTTMVSLILEGARLDPTALIGGEVKNIGGNYLCGKSDIVVVEACEYDRSFLDLYPYVAIVTNIEEDHLDYYRDLDEIMDAFRVFVRKIPKDGLLIIAADDENCREIAKAATCQVVGFGFGSRAQTGRGIAHYWEVEEVSQQDGTTVFSLSDGSSSFSFSMKIPGKHNVANAVAAIIASHFLGVEMDVSRRVLSEFTGTKRRFEIKGMKNGITVVDDYAHHPTEIRATLEGAKSFFPNRRIITIFEPHQYSRTYALRNEFAESFGYASEVIIPDIYAVRDSQEDIEKIKAQDLVDQINKNAVYAQYIPDYSEIVEYLKRNSQPGDVIITMGAGNIYRVGEEYLEE